MAKTTTTPATRPAHWVIGETTKDGYTVVRVRAFFAVLKNDEKPAKWAVEFIDGKRKTAKTSSEAGQMGRDYRDAQTAKGVQVKRTRKAAEAPAKKAPAKKAPAKAPAKATRRPGTTEAITAKAPAKPRGAARKAAGNAKKA